MATVTFLIWPIDDRALHIRRIFPTFWNIAVLILVRIVCNQIAVNSFWLSKLCDALLLNCN